MRAVELLEFGNAFGRVRGLRISHAIHDIDDDLTVGFGAGQGIDGGLDALDATFTVEGSRAWIAGFGAAGGLAGAGLLVADLLLPIPSTLVMSALGLAYGTLIDRLIALAIERHAAKQQLRTSAF